MSKINGVEVRFQGLQTGQPCPQLQRALRLRPRSDPRPPWWGLCMWPEAPALECMKAGTCEAAARGLAPGLGVGSAPGETTLWPARGHLPCPQGRPNSRAAACCLGMWAQESQPFGFFKTSQEPYFQVRSPDSSGMVTDTHGAKQTAGHTKRHLPATPLPMAKQPPRMKAVTCLPRFPALRVAEAAHVMDGSPPRRL